MGAEGEGASELWGSSTGEGDGVLSAGGSGSEDPWPAGGEASAGAVEGAGGGASVWLLTTGGTGAVNCGDVLKQQNNHMSRRYILQLFSLVTNVPTTS